MGFIKNFLEKLVPVPRELAYVLAISKEKELFMVSVQEEKKKKEYVYSVIYETGKHGVKNEPQSKTAVIPPEAFGTKESFKETFYKLEGLSKFPLESFEDMWNQIENKL
ncbi:MAG: hypothetical protein E7564_05665 [Ruminococcaceae bacterium]|nr:hypothetical protein [Oscillospiraceae bacterium]